MHFYEVPNTQALSDRNLRNSNLIQFNGFTHKKPEHSYKINLMSSVIVNSICMEFHIEFTAL